MYEIHKMPSSKMHRRTHYGNGSTCFPSGVSEYMPRSMGVSITYGSSDISKTEHKGKIKEPGYDYVIFLASNALRLLIILFFSWQIFELPGLISVTFLVGIAVVCAILAMAIHTKKGFLAGVLLYNAAIILSYELYILYAYVFIAEKYDFFGEIYKLWLL